MVAFLNLYGIKIKSMSLKWVIALSDYLYFELENIESRCFIAISIYLIKIIIQFRFLISIFCVTAR